MLPLDWNGLLARTVWGESCEYLRVGTEPASGAELFLQRHEAGDYPQGPGSFPLLFVAGGDLFSPLALSTIFISALRKASEERKFLFGCLCGELWARSC